MQLSKAELERIFPGNSEMAQRMRAFDWSRTPVGTIDSWPQSLKTTISMILCSRYPMLIWWGNELISFYNDAYIPVHGKRHPAALGQPAKEVWYEIWHQVGPQMEQVLHTGQAVKYDQTPLILERNGFTEETYFTYAYSPVSDGHGNTGGVLSICSEETARVLNQRRLQTLRALGEASTSRTPQAACNAAAALLSRCSHDLPFVLLYLLDADGRAQLSGCVGLKATSKAAPAIIDIENPNDLWPLHQVALAGKAITLDHLNWQKYGRLPGGAWPESSQRAAILPVTKPGQTQLAGFIIAGISPRLTFDDDYRGFLDLLAGHISTAVANAETYEAEHKRLTALAELQRELSISNERLKLAIEGAGDGVWDWDMQSGKITRSRRFLEILGQEEQQEITSYEAWSDLVHPNDMAKVMAAVDACIHNSPAPYICEYRMRCSNGDWKWLLSRGIVVARDTDGTPLRMTGTISDISEKRRMDETIWQHANFDSLTGLPNRRLFRDRLNQEILKSQRTGLPMALFFIDLDQFKEVNDLLGHDVGDMLLGEASKRICACVRQSDTVARLGGDEFTTIVSELEDVANVESVAQKIIAALSEPFHLGDEVIYLSASLGITMYPADADNAERLIRNADQAMYAAKNAGRNQFSYFTRSMQEEALARLRLIGDLRHALEYGQLKAHYQPVVDLSTGHIVKAEALLRWDHPHFGLLQPPAFIPLAEESGLIHEIGNWIFMEAALSSRQWSEQLGELFPISVNKSPVQLVSQNKGINWAQHLEALGMEGSSITIEITESLLLNASTNVHNKLLRYREAGLEIAIDDFGTGYSSMAYLKKFDVDYLKIDRSFIRDMTHDAGNLTIVKSVIVMAHELGLKVIAEGIENEEQRQLLAEAGCDFGQGFLYAEPLPAQQFETLLLSNYIYRRQPYQLSASVYKLIS